MATSLISSPLSLPTLFYYHWLVATPVVPLRLSSNYLACWSTELGQWGWSHAGLMPSSNTRPCNTATFTAKRGIYCGGGEVGQGIFTKQIRHSPPCNKLIERAASHYQRVLNCLRRTLYVLPCQVVLQFRLTTPLHQSRPTSAFRNYRPTSPTQLRARE